jgi:hypothetical protein
MLPAQTAISSAHEAFDAAGNLKDEKQQQQILDQGRDLSSFIAQLNKMDF